ncbi:NADPH-dependent 7-cyano-7-deazaguanine reductase QueF [Reinekea marina]|uniref:NADPH-dependent 7-cyano-7-deazaguanine reductase n=1 Tax=Reinekea marina TaxID=1310421 RepID=A0ABV7WVM0_9GAMM|nr:NADPH-dependent 7-cyano-7-deazaguanine reductase QueF [Reinekea marina]MDN3650162.1 NADPH-dependent 7-cyano-7-deazaguanine reductase QueF [Reinekea marina]
MATPEQSPLGKSSAYIDQYDPSLLFPIPRIEKRLELGIEGELPFSGVDIWNAYELSWLNLKGKPVVALAEFFIPASSPNLIESKSFKLYLNSFNQSKFDSLQSVQNKLEADLSSAAGAEVHATVVYLHQAGHSADIGTIEAQCIDDHDVDIEHYQTLPNMLVANSEVLVTERLISHLLKSNCLVTGQPDWGSVVIEYTGPKIDQQALLKYLISFRQHNEFHEQCVERIYTDLMAQCHCESLSVYARYTRRGGLDINPFRSNVEGAQPENIRLVRQ